jgi:hypothetical protein
MKNIQVIDGAANCSYSVFAASDEDFDLIFPNGQDIEFADDLFLRLGNELAEAITGRLWDKPVEKKEVRGIHGTLFYQLEHKKKFYPTKKGAEAINVF